MSGRGKHGGPISFTCPSCRNARRAALRDLLTITGRWRRARGFRSRRAMRITVEYKCACGHVGWSGHVDLTRVPGVVELVDLVKRTAPGGVV